MEKIHSDQMLYLADFGDIQENETRESLVRKRTLSKVEVISHEPEHEADASSEGSRVSMCVT